MGWFVVVDARAACRVRVRAARTSGLATFGAGVGLVITPLTHTPTRASKTQAYSFFQSIPLMRAAAHAHGGVLSHQQRRTTPFTLGHPTVSTR